MGVRCAQFLGLTTQMYYEKIGRDAAFGAFGRLFGLQKLRFP
jgi:hypothetical protein